MRVQLSEVLSKVYLVYYLRPKLSPRQHCYTAILRSKIALKPPDGKLHGLLPLSHLQVDVPHRSDAPRATQHRVLLRSGTGARAGLRGRRRVLACGDAVLVPLDVP
jgi:hypothetical protein